MRKRLLKRYIENKKSNSVVFRDCLGYTLSLPNTVTSGTLKVCKGVFYACDGCLPLFNTILWENDGEYITFYEIDYNKDSEEKTNARHKN
jgi:hypothetical protein